MSGRFCSRWSALIAATSVLRIRSERPTPRAASGLLGSENQDKRGTDNEPVPPGETPGTLPPVLGCALTQDDELTAVSVVMLLPDVTPFAMVARPPMKASVSMIWPALATATFWLSSLPVTRESNRQHTRGFAAS